MKPMTEVSAQVERALVQTKGTLGSRCSFHGQCKREAWAFSAIYLILFSYIFLQNPFPAR